MKRLFAVIASLALIAAGCATTVTGKEEGSSQQAASSPQGAIGMMGGGHGGEAPLITRALEQREQLGLTADQVATLEQARSEFAQDARRRLGEIQAVERELGELLRQPEVDLTRVEAEVREIGRLQGDLRFARIKTLEKGKAVLTPEQRTKLLSQTSSPSQASSTTGMMSGRGVEEMQRFMQSERGPRAMSAMMEMARRMGDGDLMLGMVRMMEMMGSMGGMMGGEGGSMMGGQPRQDAPPERK